jgi:hypothetical protein
LSLIRLLINDLFAGTPDAGRPSINWSPSALSSGVYLIRLQAGNETMTRKAVIIK